MTTNKRLILGQDPRILAALVANVISWIVRTFAPSLLPRLLPKIAQEGSGGGKCVVIGRPGGVEQLRWITLQPGLATCGYNVFAAASSNSKLFIAERELPPDCVLLDNKAFSINFADCCIRWGLYESANQFVGWPICPGFDVAGTVLAVGSAVSNLKVGDRVFGCSFFGSYSTRIVIPAIQLRVIPEQLKTFAEAAAIPAVALTSLYALALAGHYPSCKFSNKAVLIHSAAGGVGGMLVQMAKALGAFPIVGLVGRAEKLVAARDSGCDHAFVRTENNLWDKIEEVAPQGFSAVMDASGVETLSQSYDHLALAGRLIVYGFHTNLPVGKDSLNPLEWVRMAFKKEQMPKFDAMDMVESNKAVLAFNLSFFSKECDALSELFDQVLQWIDEGKIHCPRLIELSMGEVRQAHDLIQSGASTGKIVLSTDSL
jgi:synaptic vesicle membrane protein VAT-1